MDQPLPLVRDVVLIGGGHSHALLLRRWGMAPVPGARLTVINPAPTAPYTGMLPGHIAGHYGRDSLEIDLVRLARFAGARVILGSVSGLDADARRISLPGRPDLRYDIASIDVGITSDMPSLPGFSDFGTPAKPLGRLAKRWRAFLEETTPGPVVILGGGVAGAELALAMRHRLSTAGLSPEVTVIDRDDILTGTSPRARQRLMSELALANIRLLPGTRVVRVTGDAVEIEGAPPLAASFVVGAAGARPHDWLKDTGLDLTDGYVTVGADLRSTSHGDVYASGDCAHLSHAPRPKAGVFAVRAAPVLAHNIRADLIGGARKPFQPQARYLKLISLGRRAALADKWGLAPSGDWVWRWKDRIDRAFMDKLADLPAMAAPAIPKGAARGVAEALGPKPLCGGCGAKVPAGTLEAVLTRHPGPEREDVLTGSGDDAAVLSIGAARQVVTTDHVRAIWPDPFLAAKIALCHALGDIWAMGAEAQAILPQITLPRLSPEMESDWLNEIMAGAAEVAEVAGAAIVGGHTSVGAELTLGFTATGILSGPARTLGGARPGDRLILTRPIGTGVLLAGDMALAARGPDVAACLDRMATPDPEAARALADANALTDVTGFGLAGHLARICRASGTGADIRLDHVPLYDGAEALAARGIRSTLYEGNRALAPDLLGAADPRADLMFDPQTSGGFLAAIPEEAASRIMARHEHMTDIGRVTEEAGLRLI